MEHRSDGISADGQERPPRSPPLLAEPRCMGVNADGCARPPQSAEHSPIASSSAGGYGNGSPLPSAPGPLQGFDACKRRRLLSVSSLAAAAAPAGPLPLLLPGNQRSLPPLPPLGPEASAGQRAVDASCQPAPVRRASQLGGSIPGAGERNWQQPGSSAAAVAALPPSPHGSDSSEESTMPGHTRHQQPGGRGGAEKAAGQRGSGAARHPPRTSARRLAASESERLVEEELAVQALLALTGSY